MNFTREDVLSMVDALFHEFASSYRGEAKDSVIIMMDRTESEQKTANPEIRVIDLDEES